MQAKEAFAKNKDMTSEAEIRKAVGMGRWYVAVSEFSLVSVLVSQSTSVPARDSGGTDVGDGVQQLLLAASFPCRFWSWFIAPFTFDANSLTTMAAVLSFQLIFQIM